MGKNDYDTIRDTDAYYKQIEMDFDRIIGDDMESLTAPYEADAISRPLHATEINCPNQSHRFREILDEMYQTHLDKNADYSPANILGVGEIGIIVRMWDKMTRLMNLLGFQIKVEFIGYTGEKEAKNESITDTYTDMSVYSIIGRLYRESKWGN